MHWSTSRTKKVACRDVLATASELLTAVEGDLACFVAHLQSQPFKHGSCSRVLAAELFGRLFETSYDEQIKLAKADMRFLPAKGVGCD